MDRKYKLMLVTEDHELLESWLISTNRQTEDADVDITYPVPNYSALMVSDEMNTAIRRHIERTTEQDNTLAKNSPRVLGGFTKSIEAKTASAPETRIKCTCLPATIQGIEIHGITCPFNHLRRE